MFKTALITTIASAAILTGAHAAPFQPSSALKALTAGGSLVTNAAFKNKRAQLNAEQKLQRVLKPHYGKITITRAMRAAAGDSTMVVFDRRISSAFSDDGPNRCSFLTYKGKRAMLCEN